MTSSCLFTELNLELNSETIKTRTANLPFHILGPGLRPVSEPGSGSMVADNLRSREGILKDARSLSLRVEVPCTPSLCDKVRLT